MTGTNVDQSIEQQVHYLMDRAAISDVLIAFARAIDTRDWPGYAALFVEDGILKLPFRQIDGTFAGVTGQVNMADYVQHGQSAFVQTHHLSANHQITIDGDHAATTSYCQCVHRHDDDPSNVWELGGWYHCELRRTLVGWRFEKVCLEAVWEHGRPNLVMASPVVALPN